MARPRLKPIKPSLSAIYTNHLIKQGMAGSLEQHAVVMAEQIETLQALLRKERLQNAKLIVMLGEVVEEFAA